MMPPVSAIADVLALWGRDGWLTPPLQPIVAATKPVIGEARTVRLAAGSGGLMPLYEVLDGPLDDQFLVIAGADSVHGAVWGEILATTAKRSGVGGVLLHGSARDQPALAELATPTYAIDQQVVGPNGMATVVESNAAVNIGGVEIDPADRIVADATGCVRVRAAEVDEVLEAAVRYADAEEQVVAAVRNGTPLAEAYHMKKWAVDQLRR